MANITLPEIKKEIHALDNAVREMLGKGGNLNEGMRGLEGRIVSGRIFLDHAS